MISLFRLLFEMCMSILSSVCQPISFMFDMQGHMAIVIFKDMKSCGISPDDVTYNIMIDCCSILRCFRSASVLASMMLRSGYTPQNFTYTALIKVSLSSVLLINQETYFLHMYRKQEK